MKRKTHEFNWLESPEEDRMYVEDFAKKIFEAIEEDFVAEWEESHYGEMSSKLRIREMNSRIRTLVKNLVKLSKEK